VRTRTAVLILRFRYLLEEAAQQFAEEVMVTAFRWGDSGLEWLEGQEESLRLLSSARVTANISPVERQQQVAWALGMLRGAWYESLVSQRVRAIEESHARLRKLAKAKRLRVTPHVPPDILGCYVLVPAGGGG
jgi:hypothetical protein